MSTAVSWQMDRLLPSANSLYCFAACLTCNATKECTKHKIRQQTGETPLLFHMRPHTCTKTQQKRFFLSSLLFL